MKLTPEQKERKNKRDKEIIDELDRMIEEIKVLAEECEKDAEESETCE